MISKQLQTKIRFSALITILLLFLLTIVPLGSAFAAEPFDDLATENINKIYNKYIADEGIIYPSSYESVDPYHIYVLASAGVDVGNWSYEDITLKFKLIEMINETKTSEAEDPMNAKYVAYQYIAANALEEEALAADLLNILTGRHINNDDGTFYNGDWNQWTNLPVFDVLTKAGTINQVHIEKSVSYILELQVVDGSFGDFMSTVQAVRSLNALKDHSTNHNIETAIDDAINWLKTKVQENGSVTVSGEDPVTNTADIVIMLNALGESLNSWKHGDTENGPADYLGTIDFTHRNVGSNAWALEAYLLLGAQPDTNIPGGGSDPGTQANVTMRIEGPEYTILPDTVVQVVGGTGYQDILIDNADALGYTVQYTDSEWGKFIDSINDIPGNDYWMVTPWQAEGYFDGAYFILYGRGSDNEGEIALSASQASVGQNITATVKIGDTPVEGATVIYYTEANMTTPTVAGTTDPNGKLIFSINTAGTYKVAADKPNTASWPDSDNGLARTAPAQVEVSLDKSQPPPQAEQKVQATVVGRNWELLFGPDEIHFAQNNPWGETALGALHATGLPYSDDGGFVKSVAGQANIGMMGWMYKVNDDVPGDAAYEYSVSPGDTVIWWYSTDPNSSGPTWAQLLEAQRTGAAVPVFGDDTDIEQLFSLAEGIVEQLAAGMLSPSDALAELSMLMSADTRAYLADTATDIDEAAEFVLYLLDKVFGMLAAHRDTTGEQLFEALTLIMENGVSAILTREGAVGVAVDSIKITAASAARKTYTRAASVPAGQLLLNNSQDELKVTINQAALQTGINLGIGMRSKVLGLLSANGLADVRKLLEAESLGVVEADISALKQGGRTVLISLGTGVEDVLKNNAVSVNVRVTPGFALRIASLQLGTGGGMLAVDWLSEDELEQLAGDIVANSHQYLTLSQSGEAFRLAVLDADGENSGGALPASVKLEVLFAVDADLPAGLSGIYRYVDGSFQFVGASGNTGREVRAPMTEDGVYLPLAYDRSFADMSSHWAREEVRFMGARQVVKGISDADFAPERTVTRAEVASMLVRALYLAVGDSSSGFTDVQVGAWYADNVSAAAASGLLVGRGEGLFAPESPLTRAELAVILSRVMAERTLPHSGPVDVLAVFADSDDIPDWAVAGMAEAVRLGLLKGRSATQLAPQETVTRAEAATLLARMLRMLEAGE